MLGLQPSANDAAIQAKLKQYAAQQEKWAASTEKEQEKARDYETDVARAEHQATRYEVGEALLQISVVLCSVTLFTRKKLYFYGGLSTDAVGLAFAATGFLVRK
jgi:lipid II:glycine glycyltransferase (peptidoglycan interpeptide bridge formation enzyme)